MVPEGDNGGVAVEPRVSGGQENLEEIENWERLDCVESLNHGCGRECVQGSERWECPNRGCGWWTLDHYWRDLHHLDHSRHRCQSLSLRTRHHCHP